MFSLIDDVKVIELKGLKFMTVEQAVGGKLGVVHIAKMGGRATWTCF